MSKRGYYIGGHTLWRTADLKGRRGQSRMELRYKPRADLTCQDWVALHKGDNLRTRNDNPDRIAITESIPVVHVVAASCSCGTI